jgi:RNA polymerase sigma-70 factor (ECF subfamily)
MLKDEDKARDAMHDVFVKLLRRKEELEDRAPSSLLFCTATTVCLNRIRSEARRSEVLDDALVGRIARAGDDQERTATRSVLARLFQGEPESSRTMAFLYLVDGMTLDEVSREVGMSPSGVRKRLGRLRQQLIELEGL